MTKKPTVAAEQCEALGHGQSALTGYPVRDTNLGGLAIQRALPIKDRRLVGPWCFLDRYGPHTFVDGTPMDVGSHPHTGLQTVTWLLEGEVLHRDSLGSEWVGHPGGVNVMTAGNGIAHAEQTPTSNSGTLSGAQLWVALPDAQRNMAPTFEGVPQVPVLEPRGGRIQVFAGALEGVRSPAPHHSELLGVDIRVHAGEAVEFALDPRFEHAVLLLAGDCTVDAQPIEARMLYYLGTTRSELTLSSRQGGRLLLIGGPPFPEKILMWWNFVARTPEEIAQARADWEGHRRFGEVNSYPGPRLAAPSLLRLARPNPAS